MHLITTGFQQSYLINIHVGLPHQHCHCIHVNLISLGAFLHYFLLRPFCGRSNKNTTGLKRNLNSYVSINPSIIPGTGDARDSTSRWSRWRADPSARSWWSLSACPTPPPSPVITPGQSIAPSLEDTTEVTVQNS